MKLEANLILSGLGTQEQGRIKTSALDRSVFAHLMRIMSFNPDFNAYVHAALVAHDLPDDPKMDWAKWLSAVYRTKVAPNNEEMRDEAIHEVLIHHLFEEDSDILRLFDPSKLSEKIRERPLAEQVSSYLKTCFIFMMGDAIKYLMKTYPSQEVVMGLTTEDPNAPSILNKIQHGVVDQEEEELVQNTELRKLRHAFSDWCMNKLSHRPATAKLLLQLFDLIVVFDGGQGELLNEFAARSGKSKAWAAQLLYHELPRYLRLFSGSPEGKGFNLAKRIRTKIEGEKHDAERALTESESTPANP